MAPDGLRQRRRLGAGIGSSPEWVPAKGCGSGSSDAKCALTKLGVPKHCTGFFHFDEQAPVASPL